MKTVEEKTAESSSEVQAFIKSLNIPREHLVLTLTLYAGFVKGATDAAAKLNANRVTLDIDFADVMSIVENAMAISLKAVGTASRIARES